MALTTRVTSESLQFKNLAKVQYSLNNSSFDSPNNNYSLICCSNIYGFIYVGVENKLMIYEYLKTESNLNDEVETNFGDDFTCKSSLLLSLSLSDYVSIDSSYNIAQLSLSSTERHLAIVVSNDDGETKIFIVQLEKCILNTHSKIPKEAFIELTNFNNSNTNTDIPSYYISWNKIGDERLLLSKSNPSEITIFHCPFIKEKTIKTVILKFPESSSLVTVDWSPAQTQSNLLIVAIQNSIKIYKDNVCVGTSKNPIFRENDEYSK